MLRIAEIPINTDSIRFVTQNSWENYRNHTFVTGFQRTRNNESIQDHVAQVMNRTPCDKSEHKYSTKHTHTDEYHNLGNVSFTCVHYIKIL